MNDVNVLGSRRSQTTTLIIRAGEVWTRGRKEEGRGGERKRKKERTRERETHTHITVKDKQIMPRVK